MSKTIYLHGMRQSGSSFLIECLEGNYDCEIDRYAVHTTIARPTDQTVVVVRNPLAWLPSIFRRFREGDWIHPRMDFTTWANGDWMQSLVPCDRWSSDKSAPTRWESRRGYCPRISDWNRTYAYWLRKGVPIVRYEDLALHPKEVCEDVAGRLGLERTSDEFEVPQEYVSYGPKRPGGRAGCVERLMRKTYLQSWDEHSLPKLQKTADPDIFEEFDYRLDVDLPELEPGDELAEDADQYDGDIYWVMRGGAGDLVMIGYAIKLVSQQGWKIDLLAGSKFSRWLSPLLNEWEGLNVLTERPEGARYRVAACDCGSQTLRERTEKIDCDHLITPRSFGGSPSDWGEDVAEQIMDLIDECRDEEHQCDRTKLYNIFRGDLPHPRVPKRVLVGPGTGSGDTENEKCWPVEHWKAVCASAPVEFRWLGKDCDEPNLQWWDECPICGGIIAGVKTNDDADAVICTEDGCGWAVTNGIGMTKTPHDVLEQMSEGALYVGVDNGLGHLAAACGLPTITVFGTTKPDKYRPNTCNSLTFGRKGQFPDPEPVADAVASMFGEVEDPLVSIIIATCNEGVELLPTAECARLKGGCPIEVVVVDDGGTDDSVSRLPGHVKVLRNDERTGVAPARQQGTEIASGKVYVFWDGHMRWSTGAGRAMAEKALSDGVVVTAPMRNLYGSTRCFGGANFEIKENKNMLASDFTGMPDGDGRYHPQAGFVAPCYAIPADIFKYVGGWPTGLRNWGQTEITLSLIIAKAGVDTVMDTEVTFWHLFRPSFSDAGYSGVSVKDKYRNNYRMCRICFETDTFEEFWLPLMRQNRYHGEGCEEWNEQDEADRQAFRRINTMGDEEFFERVLDTTIEKAKETFLEGGEG